MSSHREENQLATALRELRPAPRPEFAEQLDARVATGFPRQTPDGSSALVRALGRLRATPPRRLLLSAGGIAVAAVIVATAVVAGGGGRESLSRPAAGLSLPSVPGGGVTDQARPSAEGAPSRPSSAENETRATSTGSEEVFEAAASEEAVEGTRSGGTPRSGPYASHHNGRDIERGASITLADDASKVRSDAARVFEAVHATNGIVLRSAIRDGSSGEAGATFELLIPTAKLGDAMASLAGIAEVRARHESTQDITAPTVGAGEKLQDSSARVRGLLAQLANADTDAERTAVEIRLRGERGRMAALRSQLAELRRRANLSRVSLRIETGASSQGAGSGWGIGDGLDDAGRILAIAAGVAVIGLALLAPLAALALLGWLAHRAWLRRARANALA